MTETFDSFKFHYDLSRKLPFTNLSNNVPNVKFVSEENSLTGFNITLQKSMELEEAQLESDGYAYVLSDLISIKSHKYTIPSLSGYEAVDAAGNTHVQGSLILKWDVEGAPAKLDTIYQVAAILNSDKSEIKVHLSYLAKAVVLEYEHFPDHSIIEAFKIIEKHDTFPFYFRYFALRNVLAHSPSYFPSQ